MPLPALTRQCRLARGIGGEARLGDLAVDAADVHNRSALTLELRQQRSTDHHGRHEIDVYCLLPIAGSKLFKRSQVLHGCVVHNCHEFAIFCG